MSNTSNRWKSQGGINRRATNNILSNNKQATNTLTIPQQLGISNTTIEQYGDVHDISNTVLNNTQIGGILDISGQMKVYNEATFHETAYFYKGVVDSCNTIIYDTSAVNHIDIFTTKDDTNHTASIFIQNAHGVPNSDYHMPSMLVYNQQPLTNQAMSTASMENLIFSISGENVSIGKIYGQNTFDVSGNSSFLGKVGIGKSETSMVTSNSATLDVSGSVSISGGTIIHGSLDVSQNITSNASIILDQSSSSINIGELDNQIHIGNDKKVSYFDSFYEPIHFRTVQTDDNNKNTQFAIDQSGNVGIGNNNTNPQYTLDVSGTMYVSSSLDVSGVATFQDITYGTTPGSDASGQEFPTCEWINDYIQKDGGWITEASNNNINGIYNSNIDKQKGYVGIGTKTPEYTLDVNGDIHMINGDLILEDGDISMNGSVVSSGSITADGSITTRADMNVKQNITVDGSANIGFDMTIGGKVGIGLGTETIDPSFVLDISGDTYSNGNILTRGKVGIGERGTEVNGVQSGKNKPEATLDVGGTMRVSGQVNFMGPVYGPAPTTSSEIHDASYGLQLVTMTWVADAIGASGGWIANNNVIYNGNIDNTDAFVGIGTKTPTSTLDVSGNTNLNGNLKMIGGSIFHSDMDISQNKITVKDIAASAITVPAINSNTIANTGNCYVGGTTILNKGINIGSSPYDSINQIQPTGASNPVLPGTSIQWNRVIGGGRTYIMNNKGTGFGGFSFGDINNNNDYTEMLFMGNLPIEQTYDNSASSTGILQTPIVNTLRIYPSFAEIGGMYGGVGHVAQTIGVNIKQPDEDGNIKQLSVSGGISGASAINFCADGESGSSDSAQFSIWTSPQDSIVNSHLEQRVSVCGNGNVGIGTGSPTSTLDVMGTLRVSGLATLNGDMDISQHKITVNDISASAITVPAINSNTIANTGNCYVGGTTILNGDMDISQHKITVNDISASAITVPAINSNTIANTGNCYVGTLQVSGLATLNSTLNVSGVCTMDQESGFSGKDKINIIPIPNPLGADFSGNTSNINMWGTFTNDDGGYHDNGPRQTATIQSGFSNQKNNTVGFDSAFFKGAWGGEYLSFKVGNRNSSSNMMNSSSMTPSTFSDISGVDLNNEVMRITAEGNVGIGTDSPTSTLEVNGNIKCYNNNNTAKIESNTFNATSDLRLKENIHDLSNSLEKICAIRGVEYNWKADEAKKLHSGVIAQEVKESIPEAVNSENKEQYSVDYNAIIGHLIEAVKTLKQEVDDLKGQMNK